MEQSKYYDCDMLLTLTGSDYSLNQTPPVKTSSFNHLVDELFNGQVSELKPDSMEIDIQKEFASETSNSCLKQLTEFTADGGDKASTSTLQLLAPQQAHIGGVTNLAHNLEECPSASTVQMTYVPEALHHACGGIRNGTTQESEPELLVEIQRVTQGQCLMPSLPIFQVGGGRQAERQSQQLIQQLGELSPDDVEEFLPPCSSPNPRPAAAVFHIGQVVGAETFDEESMLEEQQLPEAQAPQGVSRIAEPVQAAELAQAIEQLNVEPLQDEAPHQDDSSVENMAKFVISAVKRFHNIGAAVSSNGKIQVHEVVIVLLLAPYYRCSSFLGGVMSFCNKEGRETAVPSGHFVAKDTKTIGRLWQKLKKNSNANYDTFARAMRVGRERQKEYFEYLDAGKGAKKRVYKLGQKSLRELDRMRDVLRALD